MTESERDLTGLHGALATAAAKEGLLDVAYRTWPCRIGTLLLAATPSGLVRVAFEREGFDEVLADLAARISPRILEEPGPLDVAVEELGEYLAGSRRSFDLPLDHRLSGGFRGRVQQWLPRIAYGTTQSYAEVAEHVGSPRAVRAVGSACATNPLPLIVPCHRVLRTDGSLGGYLGGLEVKRALLDLERAV